MKNRFARVVAVVFSCLIAAAVWAVLYPGFAVTQMQDYVMRKTGRSLVVNGGASLAFFPHLSVRMDDISISNPMGMDGAFAKAGHAELPISMGDLLQRKIRIRDMALSAPSFNFLVDAQGRANWIVNDGSEGSVKSDKTVTPKEPLSINIEDGQANFLDERNGQAYRLSNATGRVMVGEDGELDISGTAAINAQFASINAHLKSLARVAQDGSPADIAIKAPSLTLNFDGRLGTRKSLNLVGTLEATSPDVRLFAKWLGSDIGGKAGLKEFTLSSALDSSGVDITLSKAKIGLDGMTGDGSVALDLNKKIPRIVANLSTQLLNLDPYMGSNGSSTGETALGDEGWKTTALNVASLKGIDASFAFSAFRVKWKDAVWGPVDITGALKDSVLQAAFQDGALYGGKANVKMALDGAGEVPSLQLDFQSHDLAAQNFLSQFFQLKWLSGTAAINASLQTSGPSQQEMMANLKGTFSIAVKDGELIGLNIMEKISKISSAILDGWGDQNDNPSAFSEASASFAVQDGIAVSRDVRIDTPLASISGEGNVDMLRRALDFKFDPKIASGDSQVSSLPVKIVVKGPWNKPRIYPDMAGILENPQAAYQALRDLGLPEVSHDDMKKIEKKGKKFLKKLFGN